ncbi:hypothetical protein BJX63DRAFT_437204 [Aspergillus granulosus]|uniref:Fungal-type protein kinase domain-containing protein n=1 Tax=Aspergillus granulosus TaxID=176169 RepID=A0ABR4GVZ0_9EURO
MPPDTSNTVPIENSLDTVWDSFQKACRKQDLAVTLDSLDSFSIAETQLLMVNLISALQYLPDIESPPSASGRDNLLSDLLQLTMRISSNNFEVGQAKLLLKAVLGKQPDSSIWKQLYTILPESTPPPSAAKLVDQTPHQHATSSLVNSSEFRYNFNNILREELSSVYIGVPGFHNAFFSQIQGLQDTAAAVFAKCKEGENPLFTKDIGWSGWPADAKEKNIIDWLDKLVCKLQGLAVQAGSPKVTSRTFFAQPTKALQGSTADRKLDIAFIQKIDNNPNNAWTDIMVFGELKSNKAADTLSATWLDLEHYAREVLSAQDTRIFALGFSLCSSIMRIWEFDRAGAIASSPFDINKDGQQFVLSILGFLYMDHSQLGFDPTIHTSSDGERYIQIVRDGRSERIVIDQLMQRSPCIVGRATTCWKAHCQGNNHAKIPLVIKDSWQYPERDEEGELLRMATEGGVVKVARYYHHETVKVGGEVDDICGLRKGLDLSQATHRQTTPSEFSRSDAEGTTSVAGDCPSSSKKRERSTKQGQEILNRVHRRVIVQDYGIPIYKAKSPLVMLSAIESCLDGYKSLHEKVDLLQGDISIGNLMLSDGEDQPWPGFLVDLDLAIKVSRQEPSGAPAKTGTRAFMAIGLLVGKPHTFMHDLESFFWVIFWICIHYNGPTNRSEVIPEFEKWNYISMAELADSKKGLVTEEEDFVQKVDKYITQFYRPLAPWLNCLRKVVFPGGKRRKGTDPTLYSDMKKVLQEAQEDPNVQAMPCD